MVDPVMIAIATTVAAKAAHGLSEATRAAVGRLMRRIRGRLAADPDGEAVLNSACADPDDRRLVERLAAVLADAAERDPAFGADVSRLWTAVQDSRVTASNGGVVNQVSGTVGATVVQARDVSGGITFGAQPGAGSRDDR